LAQRKAKSKSEEQPYYTSPVPGGGWWTLRLQYRLQLHSRLLWPLVTSGLCIGPN